MSNEQRAMTNGEWKMENETRNTKDARWKMKDERWKMTWKLRDVFDRNFSRDIVSDSSWILGVVTFSLFCFLLSAFCFCFCFLIAQFIERYLIKTKIYQQICWNLGHL
jgi:hypothetical protein